MRKQTAKTEESNRKNKVNSVATTKNGEMKSFNFREVVNAEKVKKVQIETNNITIHVIPSYGDDIIATLKGNGNMNEKIKLEFVQAKGELDIYAMLPEEGSFANVLLEVEVPKKTYEYLRAECKYNGDVTYAPGLVAEKIKAVTLYGTVDFQEASARKIILKAGNGSVKAKIVAQDDVEINIAANGIVVAELHNFKEQNVRITSTRGSVRNNMKLDGNFTLHGKISAVNGTVCLM